MLAGFIPSFGRKVSDELTPLPTIHARMTTTCTFLIHRALGTYYFSVTLLNLTVMFELPPGGRLMPLEATFPDSTQTLRSYSSSPKSDIRRALAIHGFQTTVEADPCFSTRILRLRRGSKIATVPVEFGYMRSTSPAMRSVSLVSVFSTNPATVSI